jgi:hypothetical protein
MGLESFVWESIRVNLVMGPQIYSKKCTLMEKIAGYKKVLKSQIKETIKRLCVETHPTINCEHVCVQFEFDFKFNIWFTV